MGLWNICVSSVWSLDFGKDLRGGNANVMDADMGEENGLKSLGSCASAVRAMVFLLLVIDLGWYLCMWLLTIENLADCFGIGFPGMLMVMVCIVLCVFTDFSQYVVLSCGGCA